MKLLKYAEEKYCKICEYFLSYPYLTDDNHNYCIDCTLRCENMDCEQRFLEDDNEFDDNNICECILCENCFEYCSCGTKICTKCSIINCKCIYKLLKQYVIKDLAKIIFDYCIDKEGDYYIKLDLD
jgi:hypothetical protein